MANMASAPGKRKGVTSPNASTHPSPSSQTIQLPRLKLSFRNTPPPPPAARAPAKVYARNRAGPSTQRRNVLDDSDSDLTPEETDDDDEEEHDDDEDMAQDEDEEDEQQYTPRMSKSQKGKNVESATKSSTKAASKAAAGRKSSPTKKKTSSNAPAIKKKSTGAVTPASVKKTLGTEGPGGREKKKAVKVGDKARRRARDEKLGMGYADGYEATPSRIRSPMTLLDSDSDSSYGDDESDHDASLVPAMQQQQSYVINTNGYGYETDHEHDADLTEDEHLSGLPMAFAGQEIEDLAYGGGRPELDMESQVLSGSWENDEDEDEELFISQLSGSEAELQSQSSVHESDSAESSSEESSTDDELDEFGFPRPSMAPPSAENAPLVLMENWDGQFVLVQPRQEKTKRRRDSKGSRDSRTAGSVGGSTVLSQADQQALLIDADAEDASSSEWSGLSEEEDCGDTTDSMEEDDMPLLDSPALDVIIGEQMGGLSAFGNGDAKDAFEVGPPSIVVTDPTGTPSLPPPGLQTPGHPLAINGDMNCNVNGMINGHPPAPSTPAALPTMGTFHPTTDDPACHAVIDGSKTTTKSPFTHGRRSRHNRANSVSTTKSSVIGGGVERKRKSSITPQLFPDPFFPPSTLPKRARYSSIPGHPRFVAAKRQAERERMALLEEEETSDEEIGMDLEDMLEGEMLAHDGHGHGHGHHGGHGFRFDRVPVSTYLRRNFGGGAGAVPGGGHAKRREQDLVAMSSPSAARGMSYGLGMGMESHGPYSPGSHDHGLGMGPIGDEGWGLGNTLAGPPARMMLVSPGLPAVREGVNGNGYAHEGASSRKERRRKKRAVPVDTALDVPALQI